MDNPREYVQVKAPLTHDAIIDFVLTNPTATYREIAMTFGYTPEGIGVICRSDAFQARYEARKVEMVDPIVQQSIEDRLKGLMHASIDILSKKLATSTDEKLALATIDAASKANQYGARGSNVSGDVTFVVNLPGPAESSTAWSTKFGNKPAMVFENEAVVEVLPVTPEIEALQPSLF